MVEANILRLGRYKKIVLMVAALLAASAGPAVAQSFDGGLTGFMNPGTLNDCQKKYAPSYEEWRTAFDDHHQCVFEPLPEILRYVKVPECGGTLEFKHCESVGARNCVARRALDQQVETCRAKAKRNMELAREQERVEKAREQAEAEAARQAERQNRLALEMAARASLEGRPADLARIADRMGKRAGRALGVGDSAAMRLSDQVSRIALGSFDRLSTRATSQLGAAVGNGAFDLDSTGGENAGSGAIGSSTQLSNGGLGDMATATETLVKNWNQMPPLAQAITILALAAQIVEIHNDSGRSRPSLIDGSFASNIARFSEAAARGEVRMDEDFDQYAALSQVAESQMDQKKTIVEEGSSTEEIQTEEQEKVRPSDDEMPVEEQSHAEVLATQCLYTFQTVKPTSTGDLYLFNMENTCKDVIICYITIKEGRFRIAVHPGDAGQQGTRTPDFSYVCHYQE